MDVKVLKIAAETLKISMEDALSNSEEIEKDSLFYFWNPIRGGVAVLVDAEGEKLAASSAIGFEKHLQAYRDGKRN